jgi:hypothetical protein
MTQAELLEYERRPALKKKKDRYRRIEDFDIKFKNSIADGWAFGVRESFRKVLDILYIQYVDKEKTRELRGRIGRTKHKSHKTLRVYRMAWTRGSPPLRSFDVGHVFYDPPAARQLVWSDALKVLRRVVQVCDAEPDAKSGLQGWVRFVINYYDERGYIVRIEERTVSQANFELFLRSGH